jgi:hypothetical protein
MAPTNPSKPDKWHSIRLRISNSLWRVFQPTNLVLSLAKNEEQLVLQFRRMNSCGGIEITGDGLIVTYKQEYLPVEDIWMQCLQFGQQPCALIETLDGQSEEIEEILTSTAATTTYLEFAGRLKFLRTALSWLQATERLFGGYFVSFWYCGCIIISLT